MSHFSSKEYRNIFQEVGYSLEEIDKKIQDTWDALFVHKDTKIYEETEDMGYMIDTGNNDVRTEGQSYGMMMAVQMNRQDIFDRIWKWTETYMRNREGEFKGYFAWHATLEGKKIDIGPAPDGEEFFAMALFFASNRWKDREYPFNYSEQAKELLSICIHKGENNEPGESMWDLKTHLIKFVPDCDFTDPSYHLPHFYELFALWSYEEDRDFWKEAAKASRKYIPKACHQKTGMNPEYAHYDGKPNPLRGHGDFYSDSYRVAANIGLDAEWFGENKELAECVRKLLVYFDGNSINDYQKYKIDGTPLEEPALHPVGLIATNAMGSLSLKEQELTKKVVKQFWNTPLRTGERRYYDNCLYFFSVLALSGNYRIYG